MTELREQFGCDKCWSDSADQARDALLTLVTETRLVDESHFMVKIRSCPACSQQFVTVFTEIIDWRDGVDPQFWTVLPVSPAEALDLSACEPVTARLNALAPGRRSLRRDQPKGGEHRSFWATGIVVGPHD